MDRAVDILENVAESIDYSVVGPRDNRVHVIETRQFPFNTICHLERDFGGGSWRGCTGTIISPRVILAAGHCVYNHNLRRAPARIRISPGQLDRDTRPFGSIISTEYYAPARYVNATSAGNSDRRNFDYGIIILPRPFRAIQRFMTTRALSGADLERLRHASLVTIAGYPGDRPIGTLWKHTERLKKVEPQRIFYSVDTCPGHSGSPVWFTRGNKHIVIGVHTSGILDERGRPYGCLRDTVLAPPGLMNSGVRITPDVLADIRDRSRTIRGIRSLVRLPR